MSEILIYIFVFFIFGITMGSFFNVVGYRLSNNMSIVSPPSHCPNCNKRLGALELIPILSYIIQGGKCKHCGVKIPVFYPFVEFASGVLFVLSYLFFGMSMELIISIVFSSTLLIVVLSDIKYMIIPDELLLFSGILILIERLFVSVSIVNLIMDAAIPFLFLILLKLFGDFLFKQESLGGGDIKLLIVFGLVMGWELSILSIFLASCIALPISLLILAIKKTHIIPFGPFLSLAALIIYFLHIDISWVINVIIK